MTEKLQRRQAFRKLFPGIQIMLQAYGKKRFSQTVTENVKKALRAPTSRHLNSGETCILCPLLGGWSNQHLGARGREAKLERSLSPSCLPPVLPGRGGPRAIAGSISHPFPLHCSSSALLSTKPFYSSGCGPKQHGQAPGTSLQPELGPCRGPSAPSPPLEAAPEAGLWCSVPAISGTGLGQELSFNEILLKDSITNSHLSEWTFGAFSPWCQYCGWMFPGSIKPDANIGLFYMTAIKTA